MSPTLQKILQPVVVYLLGLAAPAVPSVVWSVLVGAVLSGTITPAHLQEFLAAHGLKEYHADNDFPHGKNGA